jgi:7-cyano-7-deazaguanine synthase
VNFDAKVPKIAPRMSKVHRPTVVGADWRRNHLTGSWTAIHSLWRLVYPLIGLKKKAIVLLSGGLDSATALADAKRSGFNCYAMSFDYGQRHQVELLLAAELAMIQGVIKHITVKVDLRQFGGSALTADIDVPKDRGEAEMDAEIPITYVPARNTVFLSYALAYAEVLGADDIFIGVNALDYSGYPDCRPEYIAAFEKTANLATKAGVSGQHMTIHTPLISLTKAQIINMGLELGVKYELTSSCYDPEPNGKPCRHCDSCLLREKGFSTLGMLDPLVVKNETPHR